MKFSILFLVAAYCAAMGVMFASPPIPKESLRRAYAGMAVGAVCGFALCAILTKSLTW